LHLGSLFAAVVSYLQARANGGQWLVRIEDVDTTRSVPGAADDMLRTLEHFGLHWDEPVLYQSERTEAYEVALANLTEQGRVFPCSCSRRELTGGDAIAGDELFYPGTCRQGMLDPSRDSAQRFRVDPGLVGFQDLWQGPFEQDVAGTVGDFVLRRKDGLFAYQLAVVVDDQFQGITEVVRGCDLLANTPRQLLLQRALGLSQPRYAHLPLLLESKGQKLSKSRSSLPVGASEAPRRSEASAGVAWAKSP